MRHPAVVGSLVLSLASLVVTSVQLPAQDAEAVAPHPALAVAGNSAHIRDALASMESILQQSRASGDRKGEANTLSAMANSHNALHQQQKAVEEFQAAREIWSQLGDKDHEATMTAHIGDVYRLWGFPEQASRYYADALATYPADDKAGRGATLNNISLTYFALNNRKRCFESLNQALDIFRELQDRRSEALALANLGTAYIYLMNDPMKAVDFLQQAITRLELLNDRDSEAGALDKIGIAWHNLGKSEMAGLSFQHALELFHQVGDTQGEAAVQKHMRTLGEQQVQASSR